MGQGAGVVRSFLEGILVLESFRRVAVPLLTCNFVAVGDQCSNHLEKVGLDVVFADVVSLLVEGDDEPDGVDGGSGTYFQLVVACVFAKKVGLHENSKGFIGPWAIVIQVP